MKSKKHGTVKIDADLMADFGECISGSKYGGNRIELTDEQRVLLEQVFSKADCNRKQFAEKFKERYGYGSIGTMTRICEREGIKVESGRARR